MADETVHAGRLIIDLLLIGFGVYLCVVGAAAVSYLTDTSEDR